MPFFSGFGDCSGFGDLNPNHTDQGSQKKNRSLERFVIWHMLRIMWGL